MTLEITFQKTGLEVREAVSRRIEQLRSRLDNRNEELDRVMDDREKLRSYLVRTAGDTFYAHGREGPRLYGEDEISSEAKEELRQMCRRILEIEQEIHRLRLIRTHVKDDQTIELSFDDLLIYGFDSEVILEE
jgi:hypothetical protein